MIASPSQPSGPAELSTDPAFARTRFCSEPDSEVMKLLRPEPLKPRAPERPRPRKLLCSKCL